MSGEIDIRLTRRSELILLLVMGATAAVLRFFQLGAVPLSAAEAAMAVSAWNLASGSGEIPVTGLSTASPLLHTLQALTFWVSGSASGALARFWPALAGSVVVYWPLLLRTHIGRGAALVAVAIHVLSPLFWVVSRTGDGMALALLCGLMVAAGCQLFTSRLDRRGLSLAGTAFGAGLAVGPEFVTVMFFGGVVFLFFPGKMRSLYNRLLPELPKLLLAAALAFILGATVFLRYPLGLSAAGDSWSTWLSNWLPLDKQRPHFLVPVLSVLHQPLVLVLGLAGVYNAVRGDPLSKVLLAVTGVGLLFGVMYAGRQSADVVWFLLPLNLLASVVVAGAWRGEMRRSDLLIVAWQVSILLMLLGFGYVLLADVAAGRSLKLLAGGWDVALKLAILLTLGVLVVLLYGSGWSWDIAWRGTVTTFVIMLVGWSAHARVLLEFGRPEVGVDLWYQERPSASTELMLETLERVSLLAVGESREVDITVLGDDNLRLAWLLRDYPNVKWMRVPSPGLASAVVITGGEGDTGVLGANYLGQEFYDNVYPQAGANESSGWAKYFLFRRGPVRQTKLLLWVREELHMAMGTAG